MESRTWTTPPWCLLALRKIPTDNPKRRDECFQRGLKWMMTFQCKDGGWAAFDKDCTKSILEKVPFADHNAMLDPECADITARILELLGYENFDNNIRRSRKALQFVRAQQEADGSWYGRWGVNYIYGTWQVLRGMRALESEHEPAVAAARARLAGKRAARGRRLGRTLQYLRRSGFQRTGAEHRFANRLGGHGLAGIRRSESAKACKRGIEYLIRTQNADGSWTELETTGTGFPKVFYLKYDMYRNSWPLLALATYKNLVAERIVGRPSRQWPRAQIDGDGVSRNCAAHYVSQSLIS